MRLREVGERGRRSVQLHRDLKGELTRSATVDRPAMATLDFHGLPLPEGKEKRVLYQSSFRTLATYAMPLADLDSEMRKLLSIRNLTAEADERKDFVGKFCVTTKSEGGTTVNVLMDRCDVGDSGNGLVVSQLKYWIDF